MHSLSRLSLLSVLVVVAGCSGMADTLGLGRNAPDEFAVVDRPPLSMPPDFSLRPPRPGAPRPQEVGTDAKAENTLFGSVASKKSNDESSSEKILLQAAGSDKADPHIRDTIDREAAQKVVGSRHLVDELLWWREGNSSSTTVDAPAEAERLKEAKEKGTTPDEGATPVITRNKSGWLGL